MRKHVLLYGLLLDVLLAQKRVPVMIAISIGNGGGDASASSPARTWREFWPPEGLSRGTKDA